MAAEDGETVCVLCRKPADVDDPDECFGPYFVSGVRRGRGLHLHTDCAVWTPEIFFKDGDLVNAPKGIKRGLATKCSVCDTYGATMACKHKRCRKRYHYDCAVEDNCVLHEDTFLMSCPRHCIPDEEQECAVCGKDGATADELVFCDTCDRVFHCACLMPPLAKPPARDNWQCPSCIEDTPTCERCGSSKNENCIVKCDNCHAQVHKDCCVESKPANKLYLCGGCDTTYYQAFVDQTEMPSSPVGAKTTVPTTPASKQIAVAPRTPSTKPEYQCPRAPVKTPVKTVVPQMIS